MKLGMTGLWSRVQEDPVFLKKAHGWLTVFWIIVTPLAFLFGWINSVAFISTISLWALVSGHWSAWQAARVEVVQFEDANVSDVLEAVEEIKNSE
jgi:hypothetical protein